MKIAGSDIIAGITAFGCMVLIGLGKDGIVTAILLTVTGFYFGGKSVSSSRDRSDK